MNAPQSPRRHPASIKMTFLNRFIHGPIKDLTPSEVKVWMIILMKSNKVGQHRFWYTELGEMAGIHRNHAKLAVKSLESKGLLKLKEGGRLKGHQASACCPPPKGTTPTRNFSAAQARASAT